MWRWYENPKVVNLGLWGGICKKALIEDFLFHLLITNLSFQWCVQSFALLDYHTIII